jgi:hypothetical protein
MKGNIITILCDRGERYLSCFWPLIYSFKN